MAIYTRVRSQYITSPTFRRNKRIHDKQRKEAEQERLANERNQTPDYSALPSLPLKYITRASYARYYYSGGLKG